jgi:hypothetical protein
MIRYKTTEIDRICHEHKVWYVANYPLCGYCGHYVKHGDLSHIIRRSASRELQTNKLNLCLAHSDCHKIWDDCPEQAIFLPRVLEILYCIYLLDLQYFYQYADHFPELFDVFEQFPEVGQEDIKHHGELIQLNYLYQ